MRLLAGDIGGTNSRLIYVQDDCHPAIQHTKTYASYNYASLIQIIEDFLSYYDIRLPLDAACLAVAGPVLSGCASITNLPWQICETELAKLLQTKHVSLINDLVAAGYAIPGLQADDVLVVQQGENMRDAGTKLNAAVIAAGTGLGASHLVYQGDHYHAFSSEAGHAGFAPETTVQEQLLAWLHEQHSHVSVEMLLSGPGIYTIYQFFRDIIGLPESTMVREAMQDADTAQVIGEHALAGDDVLCVRTLNCFIEIYGAVAGDITLHYYPVNAVYLAGGIAPKIRDMLASRTLVEAFTNKGPMRNNLQKIPLKLVLNDTLGLDGAIAYARQCYERAQPLLDRP
jgi:glucokinase